MEVEELPGTELRNVQLLTVKLYTDDRGQYFERKQRVVDFNPINASDTTVNRLRTELNIHTHTYIYRYLCCSHKHMRNYLVQTELFSIHTTNSTLPLRELPSEIILS